MELYLVRHTTPNIEKGICYGQSDLGVTSTFEQEVIAIHQKIPLTEITTIYSSPLQRCKLLAQTFKKPVLFDNRLKELDFGDWELIPWDSIPPKKINPWMEDFVNVKVPNGESYVMLQDRIVAFYNSLDHTGNDKIVLVMHAGPIRALISHIQNIDLKDSFTIKVGYGEVIKI